MPELKNLYINNQKVQVADEINRDIWYNQAKLAWLEYMYYIISCYLYVNHNRIIEANFSQNK